MAIFCGRRGSWTTFPRLSLDGSSRLHTTLGVKLKSLHIWLCDWPASRPFATSFHHLNVGGDSFLLLWSKWNRLLQDSTKKFADIFVITCIFMSSILFCYRVFCINIPVYSWKRNSDMCHALSWDEMFFGSASW